MKVACPSCQASFEADATPTAGPGLLLCDACSFVGNAPPPPIVPSQRPEAIPAPASPPTVAARRRRPKVPELSFRRPGARVEVAVPPPDAVESAPVSSEPTPISITDLDVTATSGPTVHDGGFARPERPISVFPGEPSPASRRGEELAHDDFASDVEPVSLHDLGVVLAPMAAPPPWSGAAGAQPGTSRGAADLARMAELWPTPNAVVTNDAPAMEASPPAPAVEASAVEASPLVPVVEASPPAPVVEASPLAPVVEASPPAPVVEAATPKRDAADSGIVDLRRIIAAAQERQAGGAPAAERAGKPSFFQVDSMPPPALDVDLDDAPPPSSSRADLLSLVALPSDRPRARAAEDLLHLEGGLFGERASLKALPPPDASLLAPVISLDRVSRASTRPPVGEDAPRSSSRPRPVSTPPPSRASKSGAPGPVVSERRPAAAAAAARRSGAASWVVVITGVGVACVALGFRLGSAQVPREDTRAAVVSTETPPPLATPTERSVLPVAAPRVVDAPPPPSAPEPKPVMATPTPTPTVARAAEPARPLEPARPAEPPVVKERATPPPPPPPVAVVAPPPPVAVAPPPQPAGGAEFDRGAAKAALAAAAASASGCKQGDDPSGGARVSVTFAPSGRVTSARIVSGPFQGTKTGGCIAQTFRTASVPPFSGDPVTVAKEISVQ